MKIRPLLLLAVILPIASAQAEQTVAIGNSGVMLTMDGSYRILGTALNDFPLDADGQWLFRADTALDAEPYTGFVLDQRLRYGIELRNGSFQIGTQWDLFNGQITGASWAVPRSDDEQARDDAHSTIGAHAFMPRRFALKKNWDATTFEIGLMTSHWGMGLVANDGDRDRLFGRNDLGDRVIRARFTTMPLIQSQSPAAKRLMMTVAIDAVAGDDAARLFEGELALQGIFSLVYVKSPEHRIGTYLVYREQHLLGDRRPTRVFVADGHARVPIDFGDSGWGLDLEIEVAGIFGSTKLATSYNSPFGRRWISGGGGGQATLRAPEKRLQVHLVGGIASGDADPDDELTSSFTFDRNAAPGLILFDNVLSGIDAGSYSNLTDPTRSPPPDGISGLNVEGGVRGASYLMPVVEVRPIDLLGVKVGVLFAGANSDPANGFYSFRAGGVPRNHLDQPLEGRYLGTEILWALAIGADVKPDSETSPRIEGTVQGGHLLLGPALQGGSSGLIHEILVGARMRF